MIEYLHSKWVTLERIPEQYLIGSDHTENYLLWKRPTAIMYMGRTCWFIVDIFCTELLNKGQMTLWHFMMSTAQKNVVFQISKKVQFDEQGGHDSFWYHTILEKAD